MGIFTGYCIAVELGSVLPFKKKQEIRQLITSNDGIVSFIVNQKVKIMVAFL